jgi:N-acetylornithine carbamoyltransferase
VKGRSFLHTGEFSRVELEQILATAAAFKRGDRRDRPLEGRQVALLFFNSSLRTRTSFEVGVRQLGGGVSTLEIGAGVWNLELAEGTRMEGKAAEHIKDAARYLSRVYQAICVRAFPGLENYDEDMRDAVVRAFQRHSSVPVINMESSLYHPCQGMADMLTIRERFGDRPARVLHTWTTHPKALPTSVSNSFVLAAAQMGHQVTLCHPPEFPLPEPILRQAPGVRIVHDLSEAARGAEVVYSKSWGSPRYYGRRDEETRLRCETYRGWRVDESHLAAADPAAIYMHCMPLRRNVEVTDGVLDSARCAIYDQAENRLHVQKAILTELVGP